MLGKKIEELKILEKLPSNSFLGGYELFYVTSHDCVMCSDCANRYKDDEIIEIVEYSVHWEGSSLCCDYCNKEIESIYGEIEEE